jgi:hypothetical protein
VRIFQIKSFSYKITILLHENKYKQQKTRANPFKQQNKTKLKNRAEPRTHLKKTNPKPRALQPTLNPVHCALADKETKH